VMTMEPALDLYTWATLSPDGTRVAATGRYADQDSGGAVAEWDTASGRLLAEPMRIGEGEELEAGVPVHIAFAPTGTTVAIASAGGVSAVLDPTDHDVVSTLDTHAEYALAAVFSPDGGRVATADFNGAVTLWDPSTGTPLATLHVSEVEASGVAWSPDGSTLATSGGGTLRLYDVATQRQIGSSATADGPFPYVVFTADGRSVVASDATSKVWIWPSSIDAWMLRACTIANRQLTAEEWQEFLPSLPYRSTCDADA
jgi:WD40 repeat protein